MAYTTIYAIITNNYSERKAQLLGLLEASFGVGLIFGPLIGASLFRKFGFEKTFYIYGVTFIAATSLLYYVIPEIPMGGVSSESVGNSSSVEQGTTTTTAQVMISDTRNSTLSPH